jgi:hypothetical protein
MAKSVHHGDAPVNARIKINYSGEKPIVKFEYPKKKKKQHHGSMFYVVFIGWVFFFMLCIAPIYIQDGINQWKIQFESYTAVRYSSCETHYKENYNDIIYNTCSLYSRNISYLYPNYNLMKQFIQHDGDSVPFRLPTLKSFLFILIIFAPPILIYFPFRKGWLRLFPKFQAWGTQKKIMIFTPANLDGLTAKVPYFDNIYLSYDATGEFSKYLSLVEVREYPFQYYKMKKGKPAHTVNEWVWYANFTFSQKPKTGKLIVTFK